jgi:hypothetical protein
MARYLSPVLIVSRDGVPSGYFAGCTAYLENGRLSVALDPPTVEVDDPQNHDGFVPRATVATGLRRR